MATVVQQNVFRVFMRRNARWKMHSCATAAACHHQTNDQAHQYTRAADYADYDDHHHRSTSRVSPDDGPPFAVEEE